MWIVAIAFHIVSSDLLHVRRYYANFSRLFAHRGLMGQLFYVAVFLIVRTEMILSQKQKAVEKNQSNYALQRLQQ